MKHNVLMLVLMATCCLCAQSSYASLPGLTKKCPDCGGLGRIKNWYGVQMRCENCGGDGNVWNWFGVIVIAALAISAFCKKNK